MDSFHGAQSDSTGERLAPHSQVEFLCTKFSSSLA